MRHDDAPRRKTSPGRASEDHLLVELADAPAPARLRRREIDAVEPAIGDGPAVDDGDALGALARLERALVAIPGEARAQLGELVRRVAPREHVEHALERRARQLGEGRGPAHEIEERVHRDLGVADDGHDLLREDVERVPRVERLLDCALGHARGDGRRGEEIAAVLGEDHAARDRAHRVPGAPDALEPRGDRGRRLDLHDEIDGADVEPELERRGGDDGRELAFLEAILDLQPPLARHRSVVSERQPRPRSR